MCSVKPDKRREIEFALVEKLHHLIKFTCFPEIFPRLSFCILYCMCYILLLLKKPWLPSFFFCCFLVPWKGLSRVRDGMLVTEMDLNLIQQIKDKWCFQVCEKGRVEDVLEELSRRPCRHIFNLFNGVVTKTRNGMKRKRVFHSVLFQILLPEAILYLSLNPKISDLGVPNPNSKLFVK